MTVRPTTLVATAAVGVLLLAGCTENRPAGSVTGAADARRIAVTASDTACELTAATAPSGTLTFAVTNSGSLVNEFYLLAADGLRIVAEVENIGPGLTRELVVAAPPGTYVTACKPGMVGEGLRAGFTVTD